MVATLPATQAFPAVLSGAVESSAAAFFRGSCGLTPVPDPESEYGADAAGIMSTISFVGDYQWAFALAFPEDAAVGIARTFAGFDIPFDSPDMGDVVGEIVNVIAGDVVGRLAKEKIEARMSLPTTVRGSNVSMLVPTDASTTRFAFTGPSGTCRFELVATAKPSLVPDRLSEPEPPAPRAADAPVNRIEAAPVEAPAPAEPDPAQDAWAAAMAEAERQMAEQDAIEAAARAAAGPAPTGAAATVVVRGGSRLMPLVLVLACAGWGAFAGALATKKPVPAAAAPETAPAEAPEKLPLAEIDELIRAEKYAEGLKTCVAATKKSPAPRETALALREALCLEGQGRWGEAVGAYGRAESDPDAMTAMVAVLGQARCAAQDGSYVIARALTNRVLLRSGNPAARGLPVRKEVQHLQARIALQAAGAKPLPRDATARPLLSASATNGLDWLGGEAPSTPAGDAFEVHRLLGAKGALQVSATLSKRPMRGVLDALAATAGWKMVAADGAAARLKWAVGPIEVDHMPLAEFLNVVTEGTGVKWSVQGDTLTLTADASADPAP